MSFPAFFSFLLFKKRRGVVCFESWADYSGGCRAKEMIPNGMGALAFFLDTEKNVMGLWSEK